MSDTEPRVTWEARYGASPVWSGRVNDTVRAWGDAHPPHPGGKALDLACGEGGDALWLAQAGWQVTGVDFASAAIARAKQAAAERGLTVTWFTADLATWAPDGAYGLVSLSFFHESRETRHAVWRVAASAVAQGGSLLITAHAPDADPTAPGPPAHRRFGLDELVDCIGEGWTLNYREASREAVGHHAGHVVTDMVAEFRREIAPGAPNAR
ncbi:class I SAM-dependent methyltransferase [Demequina lutea]|uniref:SAM-dependent methyltransferase n=1 Tax=Demequina lutea TaxID=431489 RepID=A0A7Y9Z9U7_9MICO|nr:class I SAM-dependent methyltransferase [Demequina lutea]NYI41434.1 SAM-dependent methyltransferase [Demequina lutea]